MLLQSPEQMRRVWVEQFLESDRSDVHTPLFQQVLMPMLVAGVLEGRPRYARWLADLAKAVSGWHRALDDDGQLLEELRSPCALFRLALKHDPNDVQARRGLIRSMLEGINYSLHEVPSGVLYSGGATMAECDLMLEELQELAKLLELEGIKEQYEPLLVYAEFHYRAYKDYLGRPHPKCYAELLAAETWGRPPEAPK